MLRKPGRSLAYRVALEILHRRHPKAILPEMTASMNVLLLQILLLGYGRVPFIVRLIPMLLAAAVLVPVLLLLSIAVIIAQTAGIKLPR